MPLIRKIFCMALALLYLAAPALSRAQAPARPGIACAAGACHCKGMKAGHACCCLMMKHAASPSSYKKGDPPCFSQGCAQPLAGLGPMPSSKPELAPQKAGLACQEAPYFPPFKLERFPAEPPSEIPDKVPLAA